MIKYIAIITKTGRGKVLNVPGFETRSTWGPRRRPQAPSFSVSSLTKTSPAVPCCLGFRGWRPMFEREDNA